MREVTFTLVYDPGTNPVMDVLQDAPAVAASAIGSCASRDRVWSVERFTGPTDPLDRLEAVWFDDTEKEEMTTTDCHAVRSHELLETTPNSRVFYTYRNNVHRCDSVIGNAARFLDLGMVFQTHRAGDTHEWRLLIRSDENVDTFFEAVERHLRDGVTLHLDRLCEARSWNADSLATVSLSKVQREALRLAVAEGYYESPRATTIEALADELDVPSSTLSYRLRRAQAALASGFIQGDD